MNQSNSNRLKIASKGKLSYTEAQDRIGREKANKQQRAKTRYNWHA